LILGHVRESCSGCTGQRWTLVAGRIRIKQALEEISGKFRLKPPKSQAGNRTIRITPETVSALLAHRERMRAEGRDVDKGPVFVNQNGGWLSQPTLYRRSFCPALRKAGLAHVKPYVTRHTSATLLLREGVSIKAVSRRLGHEDEMVTLEHYLHFLPDDDDRAVAALSGLFARQETAVGQPIVTQIECLIDCPTIVPRA
jgi:integrase